MCSFRLYDIILSHAHDPEEYSRQGGRTVAVWRWGDSLFHNRSIIHCCIQPSASPDTGGAAQPGRGIEQPRHLLWTQHHRQLARLTDERRVLDDVVSLERDPEKESQRRHRVITNGGTCAAFGKMQLKASDVLHARRGRSAEKRGEILDGADIAFGANLRIVMSSIMRRRNGLMASSVMGMLLS
jgi:hypothetical protein